MGQPFRGAFVLLFLLYFLVPQILAAQTVEPTTTVSDFQANDYLRQSVQDLVHFSLVIVCFVLLLRTAGATEKSRYLTHLAAAYGVTGVFYVASSLRNLLLFLSIGASSLNVNEVSKIIARGWSIIDVVLSLFSTFWLFLTWDLMRRYPRESISKQLYASLIAGYAAILGGLITLANRFEGLTAQFVYLLDTLLAGLAMVLIGLAIKNLSFNLVPNVDRALWTVIAWFCCLSFILWGALQPVYSVFILLEDLQVHSNNAVWLSNLAQYKLWYFGLLMAMKGICAVSIVIYSALGLRDKNRFRLQEPPSAAAVTDPVTA